MRGAMAIRGVKLGLLGLSVALSACQRTDDRPHDLVIRSAWARATAPGQESGGVFLTVRGGSAPDRLTGGSTDVAGTVEIHTMRMDGAVMRMRRQKTADIPAGDTLALAPGGTHLMLVGLKAPLAAGQSFDLALDFADAGRKQVRVRVLPIGATGPQASSDE